MTNLDEELVLHLPFDEGAEDVSSPAKVFDLSREQNHGTVTGAILIKPFEDMSNSSEDEGENPIVVYDDDETFWAKWTGAGGAYDLTLSEETTEKKRGQSSLKMVMGAGAFSELGIEHNYGAGQDFSQYDFVAFWWYGANSSDTWTVWIETGGGNQFTHQFVDDFTGWRRFIFPLERFTIGGAPDWSNINRILIYNGAVSGNDTTYLDRLTLDVGNWRFGETIDFDGVNDEILVTDATSLQITSALTISFWINRFTGGIANYRLIAKGFWAGLKGYLVQLSSAFKVQFFVSPDGTAESGVESNTVLAVDTWHHIVCVYDGSYLRIYIDGIFDNDAAYTSDICPTTSNLKICGLWSGVFKGLLDEIRIYRRVLSADEIRLLYERGVK
jgi:hypothetical protein